LIPTFWWGADEDAAHESVLGYVRSLEEAQAYQHRLNVQNAKLYANTDLLGLDWTLSPRDFSRRPQMAVSENVVMSVIDTATSMIAKNRPKATFVTDGADFSTQRRAQQLDRFIEGLFQQTDIYNEAVRVFRDAAVFGTGVMHIWADDGKIQIERVIPDEIIVDELECISSPPRQMHRRKFVHREVLKALFPDSEESIDQAHSKETGRTWTSGRQLPNHLVAVVESWHLPSNSDADDGRHCICIDGTTLLDETWEKECFPFVFYRWSELPTGWYGQGLAEQLTGIQLRINKLNKFIDRAQDLIAVPRIFVDVASKTIKAHINNEIGAIIPYRGKPPVFLSPQAVSPEVYQRLERLKASAFEFAGISQMSAQSKKPGGLESAVALREFNDIESQRFSIQSQRFEQLFLDAARQMVSLAKELYGRGRKVGSMFRERNLVRRIDWSEVDMEQDQYTIAVEASSLLSRTPAGRLQGVIELAQAGLIDTDEARRLMQHPDLEHSQSLHNSAVEDIEATIEELLDGGFSPPEPMQNLMLGISRVQMAYLRARRDGAPEEILEAMRQWMEQAQHLLEPPQPPPEPEMGAEMMPPEGAMPGPMDAIGAPPMSALADSATSLRPGV
jgi:hypothetical protein